MPTKDHATVAPYVGAWIETSGSTMWQQRWSVAPYVGAWIETIFNKSNMILQLVAPYVGAWIETGREAVQTVARVCRTLRGCVD